MFRAIWRWWTEPFTTTRWMLVVAFLLVHLIGLLLTGECW